jgi:hypothetical protein
MRKQQQEEELVCFLSPNAPERLIHPSFVAPSQFGEVALADTALYKQVL